MSLCKNDRKASIKEGPKPRELFPFIGVKNDKVRELYPIMGANDDKVGGTCHLFYTNDLCG